MTRNDGERMAALEATTHALERRQADHETRTNEHHKEIWDRIDKLRGCIVESNRAVGLKVDHLRNSMMKSQITVGGTVILLLLGVLGYLYDKLHSNGGMP